MYGDKVSIDCHPGFRVGSQDIRCASQFHIECRDDGELAYTTHSTKSALVAAVNASCVPIRCDVSEIDASNGVVVNPSLNTTVVDVGERAMIQCANGSHVKPSAYGGANPLSHHPSNFSRTCQAATCSFSAGSNCKLAGCDGLAPYRTKDGRFPVTSFSLKDGTKVNASEDGRLLIGQSMTVTCPFGYRIAPRQDPEAPDSGAMECKPDYKIEQLDCIRMTCGDYTVPTNSIGVRNGDKMSAGTVLRSVLFQERISVTCDANHRLGALDTSCNQRAFEFECGNDGKFFYIGNTTSFLSVSIMTCDPIRCNMPFIANGQRLPVSGTVRWGESVSVTCNAGYYSSPPNYTGKHALCSHPKNLDVICDNATCDFAFMPACSRPGCYGMAAYKSAGDG